MMPSSADEAREWIDVARRDLRLAGIAIAADPTLVGEGLYHAQQAAEKALKGLLVFRGLKYPLTHDIGVLLDLCSGPDPELDELLSPAAELTQFAVRFRYPGDDPPPPEFAAPWIDLARRVCTEVERRLPKGDQP